MASAQQLSSYFASFGFKLDMKSVGAVRAQVTKVKQMLERQLQLTMVITRVKIGSKRKLNASIKQQMAQFGNITLKISSFKIDAAALRRAVQDAYDRGVTLTLNPRVNRTGGGGGAGNNLLNNSRNTRFNNLPAVMDRLGSGVATMATGMGLWEINRISEDLQTSKVALGTITEGRGEEAYNWLKERGKERGFDYSSQLPVFSSYMAASINKQGYEGSLDSFAKLTDYGLTHGADKEGLKRAMTALGQMWSKGQIHQEELKSQLSEAKGFAGAREHFALAWQDKTGGKLVGQEAEAALMDAMQKGLVKSAEVLPLVIERMAIKAAGGIDAYKKTTPYAHGKFDTFFKESIELFGKGGFDEGMRNFFLTLAKGMETNQPLILKLGESFKQIMQVFLAFIDTGGKLVKMFYDFSPTITTTIALLYPVMRLFGKWGVVVALVAVAIEDVVAWLDGGNSAIGQFIEDLSTLTGFDPSPIVAVFAVIGAAVLAAFAPITAAILGIGVLVQMYDRWKKSKEALANKPMYSATNKIPTEKDLLENKDIHLAKLATDKTSSGLERTWNSARLFNQRSRDSIASFVFGDSPEGIGGLSSRVFGRNTEGGRLAVRGYDEGKINSEQLDRILYALDPARNILNAKDVANILAEAGRARTQGELNTSQYRLENMLSPLVLNVNGSFVNEKINVDGTFAMFPNGTPTPPPAETK